MVFCSKCGTKSEDGKKFCFQCGTKLAQPAPKNIEPPKEEEQEQENDNELLHWAQYQAAKKGYNIESWNLECFTDGLGFCGIISLYRDDLIDRIDTLDITAKESNLNLAIDSAVQLGIEVTLTPSDLLKNPNRTDAENKIKKFVRQLYQFFEVKKKDENTNATSSQTSNSNGEVPQFKTMEQAMAYFAKTGEMPVLPGIFATCGACKKLGVTPKMLCIDGKYYCDGPCGKNAFVQKYRGKKT